MATLHQTEPQPFMQSSGATSPVWVHLDPPSNRPQFTPLKQDLETDICIIGAGIAGISIAYELIQRGRQVTLLEAREVLSGETGRTSGHLANALDDGYTEIQKKHGSSGAQVAADSHRWAIERVGEIAKDLAIECEFRKLPGYEISQFPQGTRDHDEELKGLKEEVAHAKALGMEVEFRDDLVVKGWDGAIDQRGGAVFHNQATFHPTKYLSGVLKWLKEQPKFQLFTHTRVQSIEEKGIEILGMGHKTVKIGTEAGNVVQCNHAVEATCVPLQKLSVIAQEEYYRTYCIAIRVPKGYVEDCLLYDEAEEYMYVRLTACDERDDYLVIGGCDHKVGQEDPSGRFEELEQWVRDRFTKAGSVDYKWSGQVFEPVDYMAFIGKNQGQKHTFIVTGDSGNGLTHGVLAGKLIADEIEEKDNPWASLYSPKRVASIVKSLPSMISHDVQINAQYKRFLQSDIKDIEDLAPGYGGVMHAKTGKPVAVYKGEDGKVEKFSALCPHLHGVVCWNPLEKSWDCPVHGSRFSKEGVCVMGPAKGNLEPANKAGGEAQTQGAK
ncbi:DAO-domain-containing protein [Tothia fuscella]|uniref:DAO-domain-containing protein n=1 Tax=Tothia fuscella TaxID=1048955 RepID=A0A9P4NDW0_9PEZI|nr:DAO-domain-containing protein [Tothia fuscella]